MTKAVIEYGLRLPVDRAVKHVAPRPGLSASATWGWSRAGERIASLGYSVKLGSERAGVLVLRYELNGERRADEIAIAAAPCNFGGVRWFALCPATGRRADKLYLPPGARRFLSRRAFRLAYASQMDPPGIARVMRRQDRLLARLGDPEFPEFATFAKPKWMRWATFGPLAAKLEATHDAVDGHINELLRRLARQDRRNSRDASPPARGTD